MAFGGLRGTLTGFGTSIVTPETADGSVAVSVQDLVVVMVAEAAANTVTTVTDNLGQTYTAINAGTLSSVGLRGYYRYVTVAGTLTQVSCAMTSSSNDHAISVAVYEGPFTSTPLDRAPANTIDAATPYTCAATTVLSQANELIVAGLGLIRCQTATATSPLILALNTLSAAANTNNAVSSTIGQQLVAATTSVTPVFASSGTITGGVQIVATFRQGVVDTTRGTVSTTSTASGTGCYDISRAGTAAAVTTATTGAGRSDVAGVGSASATGTVSATGLATTVTYPLGLIAQTNKIFPLNGGTTDPIDTSGATLLFANMSLDATSAFQGLTDNKGNSWFINSAFNDAPSGAVVSNRTWSTSTSTPNVGPGHTLTVTGTNNKVVIQFSAWRSSTAQSAGQIQWLGGALPHGAGSVTAFNSGELAITTYAGVNTPTGVDAPFAIRDTVTPGTDNYATSVAYNVRSSSGALNPAWYGSGNAAVTTQLFWGTWLDANASVGQASATSSAVGVAPAAGSDTGVGSASATSTATGVSPATSPGTGLIAHAEGYGGPHGGVTNSVDTTGANLLVVHLTGTTTAGGTPSFTDSKGNTWTLIGTRGNNSGGGADYAYYVNSQTPSVGTGHSINYASANTYSSAELLAFYIPGPWTFDEIQGSIVTTPATGPSLTPDQTDELIISTTSGGDAGVSYTAVSDGLAIITSGAGGGGTNYITASAYKIQPSLTPVVATWTATAPTSTVIQIYAFKPYAPSGFATGTASATSTVIGKSPATNAYLVASYTAGTNRNDFTGETGLLFQAGNTEPLTFNRMGVRKGTGSTGFHTVNLYNWPGEFGSVGTPIRTAEVDLTGGTVGNFYYAEILEITLTYLNRYLLVAEVTNADGQFWPNDADSPVTLLGAVSGQVFAGHVNSGAAHQNTANTMYQGVDLALFVVADTTGVGTATATSTVNATGRYDVARQATSTATSTVNGTGRSDSPRQGIATATSTVNATGRSDATANTNSATATSTANATSRYDITRTGSSASTSTANATGSSDSPRQGISTATSTANATSRIDVARTGSATATSIATAQSYSGSGLATTRYVDPDTFGTPVVGRGAVTLTSTRYLDPDTFGTTARIGLNLLTTRYVDPDSFGTTTRIGYRLLQNRYVDPDNFGTTTRIGLRLTTSLYVDPDTFRTPVVARGTRNLLAAKYADPDDFGTHVIQQQGGPKYLGHNLYIDPDTFRTAVVGRGPVTLTHSRYVDPDSYGTPAVIRGTRNLTTARYVDPDTFRTPVIGQGLGVQTLVPAKYTNNNNFLAHQLHTSYSAQTTRYIDPDTYYQQILVSVYRLVSTRYVDADQFYQQRVTTHRQLLAVKYNNQSQFYSIEVILGKTVLVPLLVNHSTYGTPAITIRFAQHIDPTLYEDPDYFYSHIVRIPPTAGISTAPGRYIVTNDPLREIASNSASNNNRVIQSSKGIRTVTVL